MAVATPVKEFILSGKRKVISPITDFQTSPTSPTEPLSKASKMSVLGSTELPLSEGDIMKLGEFLKTTYLMPSLKEYTQVTINNAVSAAVQSIRSEYDAKVLTLTNINAELEEKVERLEKTVSEIQTTNDDLEQYSRRNSIRISGEPVTQDEDTDELVIDLAKEVGVTLNRENIDRSHRVGKKKMDILVKFVSYRDRQLLYDKRKDLANGKYISEDLTREKATLLYNARQLKKKIDHAFSSDGKILIYDGTRRIRIRNMNDLAPFAARPDPIIPPDNNQAGLPFQAPSYRDVVINQDAEPSAGTIDQPQGVNG